ncbi:MAG: hypothetical protein D4R97_05245 [Bacteroidetes bacterium]|nr:MAG: hypothetical protein D4R97_05245 [Bacteroidota bacterium]
MKSFVVLFLVFFLLLTVSSKAGTKLDFKTVDMLTYRCFEEKKWDSVIVVGKQALHQDIDYYYLRVRLGIAYFEKQKYIPASLHLRKARQFNSGDPMVSDYLYRAYLYTNRNEEANILKATFPVEDRETTGSKSGTLELVHFESGYTLSSDNAPKNLPTLMGHDSIYGEQDLYGNSLYNNLGLKVNISNRVSISMAYNYLNFTKTKYIQYGKAEDHLIGITDTIGGKKYNYKFPWVIYDTSFRYHVSQHEVHLGATVTFPDGFKIIPAIHWINVSYPMINSRFRMDSIQDTAFYTSVDNVYHTFPFARTSYSFDRKDTSFNNWVAALTITKDIGFFNIGVSGSWSNLNNKNQIQAGLILTYYPLGNLNFYGTSTVTGFFQGKETRLLLSQVVGAKVAPWLWLEGNFYYGDYTNANIFNGSIVYNNTGIIDYRAGANLVFVINKHIFLSLIYQYFRKENQQLYYVKNINPDTHLPLETQKTKNNPYNTNTLIGGITWKL